METRESGGRPMEIIDVRPEAATEKPVILLSPAWAVPVSIYRPALTTLKANGRRVLSFNNPRSEGRTEVTPDQQKNSKGSRFLKTRCKRRWIFSQCSTRKFPITRQLAQ